MLSLLSLSKESQNLIECIENVVAFSLEALGAMMSIRGLKNTQVEDDPVASVENYLGNVLKLEGYLKFLVENLPLALSLLQEVIWISSSSFFLVRIQWRN